MTREATPRQKTWNPVGGRAECTNKIMLVEQITAEEETDTEPQSCAPSLFD